MIRELQQSGMKNLEYLVYEDLDHSFYDSNGKSHQETIYADMQAWMKRRDRPTSPSALFDYFFNPHHFS